MEKEFGFVYIWYDRKHKRYYIGSHWGTLDDGYICSSSWMKQAYKHRPQDFKRKILSTVMDRKLLLEKEQEWLDQIKPEETNRFSKTPRYYNFNLKAYRNTWSDNPIKGKSVREKISIANKQVWISEKKRSKQSKTLKKYMSSLSSEDRSKIYGVGNNGQNWPKGSRHTNTTKNKMSIKRKEYFARGGNLTKSCFGKGNVPYNKGEKGTKFLHHPTEQKNIRINPQDIQKFLELGYVMGRMRK